MAHCSQQATMNPRKVEVDVDEASSTARELGIG